MHHPTLKQYTILSFIFFILACSTREKPVTKEEATKIAAQLTEAMALRDAKKYSELLDADAFGKRILQYSNNKLSRSTVEGTLKGIRSGDFAKSIVRGLGENGTYELVKQYEKDNQQRMVFRMYDGKLNYHDYELVKKGNQVKIADIFVYAMGDNLSNTMAQTMLSLNEHSAAVNKYSDREIQKVQIIKDYLAKKEFEKADDLYKTLPAIIRKERLYRLLYIQIASGLGNDEYLATLNRFQKEYPDATNLYLLMIDAYFLKQDYEGTLRCINSLDSLINKDKFLDYFRALVYKESGDHANQLACLERLQQNLPAFGKGALELINAYAEDKQWDKAIPLTKQYRQSKDADTATLEVLYQLHPIFKDKMEDPVQ